MFQAESEERGISDWRNGQGVGHDLKEFQLPRILAKSGVNIPP